MNCKLLQCERQARCQRHAVHVFALGIVLWVLAAKLAFALDVPGCGTVGEGFFVDYRNAISTVNSAANNRARVGLKTVEDSHFTADVETLRRGKSTTLPGADISYTLERIPNHYRALFSMLALAEKEKTSKPFQSTYSLECWFRRAIAAFPDDNTVKMIFAQYLYKSAREKEAEQQLVIASTQAAANPFTLHNIGLVYFDAKNYEQALLHAHKSYALGLRTTILKDQLIGAGKWSDTPEAPPAEPAKTP